MSREGRRQRELGRQERQHRESVRQKDSRRQASLPLPVSRRQLVADFLREFKWTIIKSLPLGIILPMTIFFGSVGPDDFAKNYAAWARKWGLTDWADWLSLYATGPHVFWGVILVSFIYLVLAFGLPFLIENTKRTTAAVVVPITVAIIIAIAVYGQHEISFDPDRHVTERQRAKLKEIIGPIAGAFPRALTVAAAENPEADGYAIELMVALALAGMKLVSFSDKMVAPMPMKALSTSVKGVFLQVPDRMNPPNEPRKLAEALNGADINTHFATNPDLSADNYILTVGLQ